MTTLLAALRARQDYLPPDIEDAKVGGRLVTSSLWSGVGVLTTTALQFIRSMIFARLLMPADFGIISLANVFTYFILIFANFGLTASVIYQRDVKRRDLATCWWGNLAVDGAAALACIVFAFASHRFLNNPQVPKVICLLTIQFMLVSVGSINAAMLRRLFLFKRSALVDIAGGAATFAGAWAGVALLHWGVYGLVAGMIFGTAVMTLLYFVLLPWLPSRTFSWRTLKEHVDYGRWFLGVNLITYGNDNADRALIGTKLDSTRLGYYDYAANLPVQIVTQLGRVLNSVLFPTFASLQNNLEELRRVLLRVLRYNALIIYPMLVGLALVARDFVAVAYGAKWAPIVLPTRIFCAYGLLLLLVYFYYPLCNGIGRPSLPFKWSLIAMPFNLALLFAGVSVGGVAGTVTAKIFMPLFTLVTLGREIMRHVGVPMRLIGRAVWPAVLCCAIMAGAVVAAGAALGAVTRSPLERLVGQVAVGAAAYAIVLRALWRTEFDGLVSLAGRLRRGA